MRDIIRNCPADESQSCTAVTQRHPEVLTVIAQLGRPDDGTDGLTKDRLTDDLSRELHSAFPGVVFNFSQTISDNVDEALSGIKGENSVKVAPISTTTNPAEHQDMLDFPAR